MAVTEEVDPRPGGSTPRQGALVIDPALARGGERTEIGQPTRAELLGETDQLQQHLCRRLGVGQSAVAGPGRDAEKLGQRGKPNPSAAALQQASGKRGRAERRLR